MLDLDNISRNYYPWLKGVSWPWPKVISPRSRSHCTHTRNPYPGHNSLLSNLIWMILHLFAVHETGVVVAGGVVFVPLWHVYFIYLFTYLFYLFFLVVAKGWNLLDDLSCSWQIWSLLIATIHPWIIIYKYSEITKSYTRPRQPCMNLTLALDI